MSKMSIISPAIQAITNIQNNAIIMTPLEVLQHMQAIVEGNDKLYRERFLAQEKAISVAEYNSEKWRANANEWRSAMDDREAKFVTKPEYSTRIDALDARLYKLEIARADQESKKDGFISGWGVLVSVIGLFLAGLSIYSWFFKSA